MVRGKWTTKTGFESDGRPRTLGVSPCKIVGKDESGGTRSRNRTTTEVRQAMTETTLQVLSTWGRVVEGGPSGTWFESVRNIYGDGQDSRIGWCERLSHQREMRALFRVTASNNVSFSRPCISHLPPHWTRGDLYNMISSVNIVRYLWLSNREECVRS